MKNQSLIDILECLSPVDELCVRVCDPVTGEILTETYDIGFSQNEYKQLILKVNVEQKTTS